MLTRWIGVARKYGASDLHIEPGMPLAMRFHGKLRILGDPVDGPSLLSAARKIIPAEHWPVFLERRSFDLSEVFGGVPCRINITQTARGVGMAIRLLSTRQPTLETLNLHSDLSELVNVDHGLVLVCGSTGSGKSTTLAALVEDINARKACHIITIEAPIEYVFRPRRAFIRQREVGRDTPSFEQALIDALREDPDVLLVGELRHRQTMQLTLDAAETGHLVLSTLHSSSPGEALQRLVSAFPAEIHSGVRGQLADCLRAVICQRLTWRDEAQLRVPECSVLVTNSAVRANIRDGHFFKLTSAMETGVSDGMWTMDRYRRWLDERRTWQRPSESDQEPADREVYRSSSLPPLWTAAGAPEPRASAGPPAEDDVYVIEPESDGAEFDRVIQELGGKPKH